LYDIRDHEPVPPPKLPAGRMADAAAVAGVSISIVDSGGQATGSTSTAPEGSLPAIISERLEGSSQVVDQRMISAATCDDPGLQARVEGDMSANSLPNQATGGAPPAPSEPGVISPGYGS
jgi:hypothetical protein